MISIFRGDSGTAMFPVSLGCSKAKGASVADCLHISSVTESHLSVTEIMFSCQCGKNMNMNRQTFKKFLVLKTGFWNSRSIWLKLVTFKFFIWKFFTMDSNM